MTPRAERSEPTRAGAEEAPARGRGRPRSVEADGAILDATLELVKEQGVHGTSIEAVAARAGVGKTTIYRRWQSKEELIAAAIGQFAPPPPELFPDHGSLLGDMEAMRAVQTALLEHSPIPIVVPRLLAELQGNPELLTFLIERLVVPVRALLALFIERAIERGEVREDIDVDAVVDVLHGIPVYLLLLNAGDFSALEERPKQIFAMLMEGIGTPG